MPSRAADATRRARPPPPVRAGLAPAQATASGAAHRLPTGRARSQPRTPLAPDTSGRLLLARDSQYESGARPNRPLGLSRGLFSLCKRMSARMENAAFSVFERNF